MMGNRIRTISRHYYKKGQYKITYYDVYGQGFCKIMEKQTSDGWIVIGHVNY